MLECYYRLNTYFTALKVLNRLMLVRDTTNNSQLNHDEIMLEAWRSRLCESHFSPIDHFYKMFMESVYHKTLDLTKFV